MRHNAPLGGSRLAGLMHCVALALLCVASSACSGDPPASSVGGTIVIATISEPELLVPLGERSAAERQVLEQLFERLAELRPGGNTTGSDDFVPRLARGWLWGRDSMTLTISLNADARWHDGRPVHAGDVAFTYALLRNAELWGDSVALNFVDSVTVVDSLTARFWFAQRHPETFYQLTAKVFILPSHILGRVPVSQLMVSPFIRNPVGSGPFMLAEWEPGAFLELVVDSLYHLGRAPPDRVIFRVEPDLATALKRVMDGDADFVESVAPGALDGVPRPSRVRALSYPGNQLLTLDFNFVSAGGAAPHPILADRNVRLALSLALDRAALLRGTLLEGASAATGPVPSWHWSADSTLLGAFPDAERSARLLDSLQWLFTGDSSVRRKGGRELRIRLLVPSGIESRMQIATGIREQWRAIGVPVDVESCEVAVCSAREIAGDFDAYLSAATFDPTAGFMRARWGSRTPAGAGGMNRVGFQNRGFDALLDSAAVERDAALRRSYYHRAWRVLVAESAAIWIAEPRRVAVVNARIRLPAIDNSSWWRSIRFWSVDPGERSSRDAKQD